MNHLRKMQQGQRTPMPLYMSAVYIVVYTVLYKYVWYVCTGTPDRDTRRVLPCGGLTSVWIHVFKRSSSNRKLRSCSGEEGQMGGLLMIVIVMNAITHATLHQQLFVEC